MSRNLRLLLISLGVILLVGGLGFGVLYVKGFSGIHHHTAPKDGQIKVACVGDSITYGHGIFGWRDKNYPAVLGELLGDAYHVENFGVSGSTVSDDGDKPYFETDEYRLSIEYGADILVFMLGTNDSKPENWTSLEDFMQKYEKMLARYTENNPDLKIYLCTPSRAFFAGGKTEGATTFDIQPNVVGSIANGIRAFALVNGYDVIDVYRITENHSEWFASDNVHPNADGARAIAEAVAQAVGK